VEFELKYTDEQEEFRREVRAWLDENSTMPAALGAPPMLPVDQTREQWEWYRSLQRKLGEKGWLYPTFPKDYGGGGLTVDHAIIIGEELGDLSERIRTGAGAVALGPLMVYATEEQKREFVVPMVRGDTKAWALWTEPDAGVDLASIKMTAIRDGDEFVFNGQKTYITGFFEADYFAILAVTDPSAPRHANLGYFFMPGDLPGIRLEKQDLINPDQQNNIYFENVRVPAKHLIGGETSGWRIAQSALEIQHGAEGGTEGIRGWFHVDTMLDEWKQRPMHTLARGDRARELMVDTRIRTHVNDLLARRNFWQNQAQQPQSYEGVQSNWFARDMILRVSEDVLDAYGMHSMVTNPEWQVNDGHAEVGHRWALMSTHGQGSYEIDKLIISRRIGLSRTHETAAPTR
jgi:alkylation response protein AidB-like acyl-CoA dehydrogenase